MGTRTSRRSRAADVMASGFRLTSLTEDTDAPNADLRILGDGLHRHNPNVKRIDVKRIIQVQVVDDVRDFQYEREALTGVFFIAETGLAHPKQGDAARQPLGMIS